MKFKSDIDIDFADRQQVLDLLNVTPAGIIRDGKLTKHNTGVYATDIPVDPFVGSASLDYQAAEDRGYMKLDLLNVHVYKQVRDETHLIKLMQEPDWAKLYDPAICGQLIHINNHYDTLLKMPEPVDTITRHLIGRTWKDVSATVWDKVEGEYSFKKSHSVAYSQLVVVNLNLLCEQV